MSAHATADVRGERGGLVGEIDRARDLLSAVAGGGTPAWTAGDGAPTSAALDHLAAAFGLDDFERLVLLICAGFELDPEFGPLCAQAFGGGPSYPTFGLAAAVLPQPRAEAFLPGSPLRLWRLVELSSGSSLMSCPVHIDERILVHLVGSEYMDSRLAGIVRVALSAKAEFGSQVSLGAQVAAAWERSWDGAAAVHVSGEDPDLVRIVTAHAGHRLRLDMLVADAETLPAEPRELEGLARLWWREAELERRMLVLDGRRLDGADATRVAAVRRLVQSVGIPVVVETGAQQALDGLTNLRVRVPKLLADEQRELWRSELDGVPGATDQALDSVVSQYRLPSADILAVAEDVRASIELGAGTDVAASLWAKCRVQARPRFGGLAQRIEPRARWEDLVLPSSQRAVLKLIVVHVGRRYTVHGRWGFGRRSARGLGLASLFAGPSGTGKTMAAEVIAAELDLDLYRIDLSQVVNKYIGETEKNLGRIFDAAEAGAGILLFDEADALFGKRSEVRDSHDRYANIETGYLLQRMEEYRGLAILTTNMKEALDTAFMRRVRFTVEFPFPDVTMRAEIWRRAFPNETPVEALDVNRLAQLNVTGGSIRNIAVNAAFLAAADESPVSMAHILESARLEAAKLQHPLTAAETRGWA